MCTKWPCLSQIFNLLIHFMLAGRQLKEKYAPVDEESEQGGLTTAAQTPSQISSAYVQPRRCTMMAATLPHQPAPAVLEQPCHMIQAQLSQPPVQPSSEQPGAQPVQLACSTRAAARRDSVMPGSMSRDTLMPSTRSQLRAVSVTQTFQSRLAVQLAALDRLQAAQPIGDPVLASALCRFVCDST